MSSLAALLWRRISHQEPRNALSIVSVSYGSIPEPASSEIIAALVKPSPPRWYFDGQHEVAALRTKS